MSELHVICKVGESEYAVPASSVFQMESYAGTTPVPGAPKHIIGIAQIRQQVVPILDLRIRFGLAPRAPSLASRIIVLRLGEKLVGLLVDSAREVQAIAPEQFKDPPSVVAAQSAGFIKSIAQLKDRVIMLLDSERVAGLEVSHG